MSRTQIPTIVSSHAGVLLSGITSDPVNGNFFTNDAQSVLVVVNTTIAEASVTVKVTALEDGAGASGLVVPDRIVSLNPGDQLMIGPFPYALYNQPDSTVYVDTTAAMLLVVASINI